MGAMLTPQIIGAGVGAAAGLLGSGNKPQTTSTAQSGNTSQYGWGYSNPWEPTNQLYGQLIENATQMGQTPTPFFPGQTYVGPSAATQEGVNMGMQSMPYYQGAAEGLSNAGSMAENTANIQGGIGLGGISNYNFLSNAADVANNPYVQNQLGSNAQQVNQQLTENWLPSINQGAQSVNALGSSRQGIAQGQGIERAAQQLANANASTMLNAYGQGLGAQQYALGQTGALQSAAGTPMNTMAAGAALQGQAGDMLNQGARNAIGYGQGVEGYQNAALQDAINRQQYQYQEPWQRMSNVQQLLSSFLPYASQFSSSQGSQGSYGNAQQNSYSNPLTGMLGGGLMGWGIGSGIK